MASKNAWPNIPKSCPNWLLQLKKYIIIKVGPNNDLRVKKGLDLRYQPTRYVVMKSNFTLWIANEGKDKVSASWARYFARISYGF